MGGVLCYIWNAHVHILNSKRLLLFSFTRVKFCDVSESVRLTIIALWQFPWISDSVKDICDKPKMFWELTIIPWYIREVQEKMKQK